MDSTGTVDHMESAVYNLNRLVAAVMVAAHKELNKTMASKHSTVTEISLDTVWLPTGIDLIRTVLG